MTVSDLLTTPIAIGTVGPTGQLFTQCPPSVASIRYRRAMVLSRDLMRAESPYELSARSVAPVESTVTLTEILHSRSQPPAAAHQDVNRVCALSPPKLCDPCVETPEGDMSICLTQLRMRAPAFCVPSRSDDEAAVAFRDSASCSNTMSAEIRSVAEIMTATRTSRSVKPLRT